MLAGGSSTPCMYEATEGVDLAEPVGGFLHEADMSCLWRALMMPAEPY